MEKSVGNGEVERIVAEPNGPADESESKAGEQHKVKVSLDEANAYRHNPCWRKSRYF